MTVTHVETSYLETPYLGDPYLVYNVNGYMGNQATFTINANKPLGMQCNIQIVDRPIAQGQQAKFVIADKLASQGQQAKFAVEDAKSLGQQAKLFISNLPSAVGQQALISLSGNPAKGMQYKEDNIAHLECGGYLEEGYLEGSYLAAGVCAHNAQQAKFIILQDTALGQQARLQIVDRQIAQGQQARFQIVDKLVTFGMQAEIIQLLSIGMQVRIVLYNTDHLRILCSFPSRGAAGAVGLNAWGFSAGQGQSWKSNSTESGDFSPFNLNTDIVEQVWRSNAPTISGISLDCDTERAQGVFVDTFAMLNHNITSSASVTLLGSNTSDFSVIGITIPLEIRSDDPNVYWISPELPNTGYRYWRVSIDDSSNPNGFIEVGAIIFGSSSIFFGECFVDQVEFQLRDYTDSVQTEGFTNVNNSRAQKKVLRLEFRSLSYLRSNFRLMRDMFRRERTVLKCLWIPTPDPDNQEYSSRFAVFSKLVQIPVESHNHKGGDADYVTFNIELDESR